MNFWETADGCNVFETLFNVLKELFEKDKVIVNGKEGKILQWVSINGNATAIIKYDDKTCGTAISSEIKFR